MRRLTRKELRMGGMSDYTALSDFLGNRDSKNIGYQTEVRKTWNGCMAIRHFSTDILTYYSDGRIVIDTNGWRSKTTNERLNDYLPPDYRIYSEGDLGWVVHTRKGNYIYHDGIEIDAQGNIDGQTTVSIHFSKLMRATFKTEEAAARYTKALYPNMLQKYFDRTKREDLKRFLAQHCQHDALLLLLTSHKGPEESWQDIAAQRLREV